MFANVSPSRSCSHGDPMVLPNSTGARARRTGIVQAQRSSNSTPENNEALQRRSSIAVLPTAFATAENNTTKGRRVSIVELMIAAKKEAAAQQEGSDEDGRGSKNAKKSLFDIFPDEQEEDDEKSGKPKKKTSKPAKKASKSNNKKGAAPKTKMSAAPKGAPGGAVGLIRGKNFFLRSYTLLFKMRKAHIIASLKYILLLYRSFCALRFCFKTSSDMVSPMS